MRLEKRKALMLSWDVHFRVLLRIHHRRNGDTEVGDGAPEI
jgi:hypothetical protein